MDTQRPLQNRVNRRAHGREHSLSVIWIFLVVTALCTACGDDGPEAECSEKLAAAPVVSVHAPLDIVHADTLEDLQNFDRFFEQSMMNDSLHDSLHSQLLQLEARWDQYNDLVRKELVARRNILNLQQLQRIMEDRN